MNTKIIFLLGSHLQITFANLNLLTSKKNRKSNVFYSMDYLFRLFASIVFHNISI